MTRYPFALLFALVAAIGLSACESKEGEGETEKKADAPVAVLKAPAGTDDKEWKLYLQQVVSQNMDGVTDRVFPYYLPADSSVVQADGRSQYDRQSEQVTAAISRTVLPGNMLAFGSPDSTKMADLITSAFSGAKPDALKGSQVLFVGKQADSDRIKAMVEASGAKYIFVEAK